MILDSNIIIYAAQPEHQFLRDFVVQHSPAVSAVSYVEVLGYHKLGNEKQLLEAFFEVATVLPISDDVLLQATKLRQLRKLTLGDALVAATALVHDRTLVTRNDQDFLWIPNLTVINPFEHKE
ncbi:MAG: type II toxin-antitoxin system VapC family toxin [Trueperaceae bacterium]